MSEEFYRDIISVAQLANYSSLNLIVLDASITPVGAMEKPKSCWPNTIIPKAKFFDIEGDFCDLDSALPHTMPCAEQFNKQARLLGINKNSQIVIYDSYGVFSSARAWWMFKSFGHENVAVLDGGLPQWMKQGFETEKAIDQQIADKDHEPDSIGSFSGEFMSEYFTDKNKVIISLFNENYRVIDARASERFYGKVPEPRDGIRSGHMPGAINLPYSELLSSGKFKSVEELIDIFSNKSSTIQRQIMTCGSGITACILALGAHMSGYKAISVYDGSWSEWGQANGLPVTKE